MTSPTLDVLLPRDAAVETLRESAVLAPFGPLQIAFTAELSKLLTLDGSVRRFPELVALGFWMRPANIQRITDDFRTRTEAVVRLPRGTVFHIAPANVDSIFVYSWMVSLLCGNRNLIRLSTRRGEQTTLLLNRLDNLLADDKWSAIRNMTCIVAYPHDDQTTHQLSSICDVRAVWGGDSTVQAIRRVQLPAYAVDLSFPSRHSLALIGASAWLNTNADSKKTAARAFFNDAYWFSQFACSSPRTVGWVGNSEDVAAARLDFWLRIREVAIAQGTSIGMRDAVEKLVVVDRYAIEHAARIESADENIVTPVWLDIPATGKDLHSGAGLFVEFAIEQLDDMVKLIDPTLQTITYFGLAREDLSEWLKNCMPGGVHRVVPFGHALDFEIHWDGVSLVDAFTRIVSIS